MITTQTWKIGNCLDLLPEIPDRSVNLILTDLPYGLTGCEWDNVIPLEPLWEQWKRILVDNGKVVLTSIQPFTTDLINSNRKWFKYEWIWEKTRSVGFLNANKQPLRIHENILVFQKEGGKYNPQKENNISKSSGDRGTGTKIYNYNPKSNPQKTEFKNYNAGGSTVSSDIYNTTPIQSKEQIKSPYKFPQTIIKGKYNPQGHGITHGIAGSGSKNYGNYETKKSKKPREGETYTHNRNTPLIKTNGDGIPYPNTILTFQSICIGNTHPTQKPVSLFEYLIKTYTDEGDMVCDPCLGSGTTLEACMRTNRNCIGFEISNEWESYYVERLKLNHNKIRRMMVND